MVVDNSFLKPISFALSNRPGPGDLLLTLITSLLFPFAFQAFLFFSLLFSLPLYSRPNPGRHCT